MKTYVGDSMMKLKGMGAIKSPDKMREIQMAENAAIRKHAEINGWGKQPSTFPEKVKVATGSAANSKE